MYLSRAVKYDKEQCEMWNDDGDGILVFTGLFSAVVTAFVIAGVQNLQPNPANTTNALLTRMSQQLSALSNGGSSVDPLTAQEVESGFKPTNSAVRVNILWLLSVSLNLYCALLVTIRQQWSLKYMRYKDRPYPLAKRARIRSYFAEGVKKFYFEVSLELIPLLMHAGMLFFYVGLLEFFLPINETISQVLLVAIAAAILWYSLLTFIGVFWHDAPYATQLTPFFWFLKKLTRLAFAWIAPRTANGQDLVKVVKQGMRRAFEDAAYALPRDIDLRALKWTLTHMDRDDDFERFLNGLPDLFQNETKECKEGWETRDVDKNTPGADFKQELEASVVPVIDRLLTTCSSGFLSKPLHKRRIDACIGAIWCLPKAAERHFEAMWARWTKGAEDPWAPLSTETWSLAQKSAKDYAVSSPHVALRAHFVQAMVAAMRIHNVWTGAKADELELLRCQLGEDFAPSNAYRRNKRSTELVLATKLFSKSMPLLIALEKNSRLTRSFRSWMGNSPREELKIVLRELLRNWRVSDLPSDLQEFVGWTQTSPPFPDPDVYQTLGGPSAQGTISGYSAHPDPGDDEQWLPVPNGSVPQNPDTGVPPNESQPLVPPWLFPEPSAAGPPQRPRQPTFPLPVATAHASGAASPPPTSPPAPAPGAGRRD
ncbi:hypothetical protein BC834DRAFT_938457 [Gloeopeniophorella convolvens]|nr:hypothetical protein BC834DRAFT_938457 [Gloeopeniophorella convolvens]